MRRRELLAGVLGLGVLGGGAALANSGTSFINDEGIAPVQVETLDAPGSEPGTMLVPEPDTVTVVDVFRTSCTECKPQLEQLRTTHDAVGDRATFVSVTNAVLGGSLTRDDITDWWREYGGPWPVAVDNEGQVTQAVGATGLPFTAIVDATGEVAWTHLGVADGESVAEAVTTTLEQE